MTARAFRYYRLDIESDEQMFNQAGLALEDLSCDNGGDHQGDVKVKERRYAGIPDMIVLAVHVQPAGWPQRRIGGRRSCVAQSRCG